MRQRKERWRGGESVCTGEPSLAVLASFGLLSCCRTSEWFRLDASICRVTLLTLKVKQENSFMAELDRAEHWAPSGDEPSPEF